MLLGPLGTETQEANKLADTKTEIIFKFEGMIFPNVVEEEALASLFAIR